MGIIARTLRNLASPASFAPIAVAPWQNGRAALPDHRYETFAREGYRSNELVYAAIEELATSAAEPRMHARVGPEWTTEHRILDLLQRPNPFMDGFEFWATVIMYRSLAGNAYALKVRSRSGKVLELWLMRPDRVTIVPSSTTYISHYEFDVGEGEPRRIPVDDVIHWKTRNPVDQFYGMPPLMAAAGRVDIDNFMKDFMKAFFLNAGVPGGLLNFKQKLGPGMREEIVNRFSNEYGGVANWHKILVIDNAEASFTAMTSEMGNGGLVVPSLDEINEARILMVFQIPPELIGARVGMQNSSYAQKRAARESFWDETLAPMYKEMAGPVNLRLVPDFPGVDEVGFDLSDVRALQEDQDKISARIRSDVNSGLRTIEEGRLLLGIEEYPDRGTFLVPVNLVPVPASELKAGSMALQDVRQAPTAASEPAEEPVPA